MHYITYIQNNLVFLISYDILIIVWRDVMKKIFSISLIFVYVLLIPVFFAGCSCSKEENGLVIGDHYNYVSYENLSYGDDERQKMNLHIPKEKTGEVGMMLFIHGGAWVAGDKSAYDSTLVDWCSGRGYVACSINYRYANISTYVGDIMNDITAAMIKIKNLHLKPKKLLSKNWDTNTKMLVIMQWQHVGSLLFQR